MDFNQNMVCIDRYGNSNNFRYSIDNSEEEDFEKIIYRVIPADIETNDWFEFSVAKIGDSTGKIVTMNNNGVPELSGMGISEKLIEIAAEQLKLKIITSSNIEAAKLLTGEWRSVSASGVWKRIVRQSKATYDRELDVYTYTP